MFKTFANIDSLIAEVALDKHLDGANAHQAHRYPIRFVLFDNFVDCYNFIDRVSSQFSLQLKSIDEWFDPEYPDTMETHSSLAKKITSYVNASTKDSVISPFSEIARFYNDITSTEFRTLIATIKGIEALKPAVEDHRRIYVPIVGLIDKMSQFEDDTQSIIWYQKSSVPQDNYKLILLNDTLYGVEGVEHQATVVNTVFEWLQIWRNYNVKSKIVCTSKSIFANAQFARPDNAFDYEPCNNVHDFLTKGLGLDLSFVGYRKEDNEYWERLAEEIDINNFNLDKFINEKFGIYELANYSVFYDMWYKLTDAYERWLVSSYYIHKFCNQGYTCECLKSCTDHSSFSILTTRLLLNIFDMENPEDVIEERKYALNLAAKSSQMLPENLQQILVEKINEVVQADGYQTALRYLTSFTDAERELLISWYADGHVTHDQIKEIYPDLYYYLCATIGTQDSSQTWCLKYIDAYKNAKVANRYTADVENIITEKNASEVAFNDWYNDFKTVRTLMASREDIDVYFWIDGLGMEWVSLISQIIKEKNNENYFLNEILIAKSLLPSATENNKQDLLKFAGESLPKCGDIDSASHKVRKYPRYIIEDMAQIRKCITKVLQANPGKKIAIISDHGISYMPQLTSGLNLSGIHGDHGGRFATWNSGTPVSDSKYKVIEGTSTICALTHESLTSKIPSGGGCHGGCSPEEVLVPILIISDKKISSTYNATLMTYELSGASPYLKFDIKGVSNIDEVYVMYNGIRYSVTCENGIYKSDAIINLSVEQKKVTLYVGSWNQTYNINISVGAEEDDLFAF